jgi:UDP-2,3-diacylglucosamine pyrophosphatase LpxH
MEVEKDPGLLAKGYERPLRYVYDASLKKDGGAFRYVFEEGALRCSVNAEQGDRKCLVSREEMSAIGRQRPGFVYIDVGCWSDNADGNGTKRRDFGMVCGPNVYLCEFTRQGVPSASSVPSVRQFIAELATYGCIVNVLGYLRARETAINTVNDPNLYLFLGDLHMPPVSWFHKTIELAMPSPAMERMPPTWFLELPAIRRHLSKRDYKLMNYYSASTVARQNNSIRKAKADIFEQAGDDLVTFLDAICNITTELKHKTHFVQTGDMFELWLGREYQYQSDGHNSLWLGAESPNRVADWILEVMIHNMPVIEAFRRLENTGLQEIKYVWGNHDSYVKDDVVTSQVGLIKRDPFYTGLNGDLYIEHGHRFDTANHDGISYLFKGPFWANAAFNVPVVRQLEGPARSVTGIGHPKERDGYLLGATLVYLHDRYDFNINPFSIYVMGHTHARKLLRYNIRAEYHLHEGSG